MRELMRRRLIFWFEVSVIVFASKRKGEEEWRKGRERMAFNLIVI